ncbi:hypothetical protein KM043_003970 [Ampulex compressa]|nr:hypothetical protein KM043_003970 [Ampulex compressa]
MIVPPKKIYPSDILAALFLLEITLIAASPLNDERFSREDFGKLESLKSCSSGNDLKCKRHRVPDNEDTKIGLANETVGLRSGVQSVKDKDRPWESGTYRRIEENKARISSSRFTGKASYAEAYASKRSDPYDGSRGKDSRQAENTQYGPADKYLMEKKTLRRRNGRFTDIAPHSPDAKVHRWKGPSFLRHKRHSDANATDYYAQRRAVMERFYSRQREIAKRYGTVSTSTARSSFKHEPRKAISDVTDVSSTSTESSRQGYSNDERQTTGYIPGKITADSSRPVFETEIPQKFNIVEQAVQSGRIDDRSNEDANTFPPRSNVQREDLKVNPTSASCPNISLSGSFAPKTRRKSYGSGNEGKEAIVEIRATGRPTRDDRPSGTGHERWGNCEGKLVYRHNLLLGLKGNSNLDAVFEVIVQGPICITCVETMRYNETRATVSLDSGGRGYDFAKLRLKGYENEGFSYIVKVWGVGKTEENCEKYKDREGKRFER